MNLFLLLALYSVFKFVPEPTSEDFKGESRESLPLAHLEKLEVIKLNDTVSQYFIHVHQIYHEKWDTLAQTKFWRNLIRLSPDSGLINIASSRKIIETVHTKSWEKKSEQEKETYRDSLRKVYKLAEDEKIFFSKGKSDFYDFEGAMATIDKGVAIFEREKTDPFYAQTILLIESPGKCAKSPVGAMGAFQLMKGVGIQMGLKVNNLVDERKDFEKSAWAAAKLIRTICVPQAREICAKYNLEYAETDLWFRLLVLHIYHAGAGNVGRAVTLIQPTEGNMNFITRLWQTKAGAFGNASQNYSQVALASLLELDEIIYDNCEDLFFHPLAYK